MGEPLEAAVAELQKKLQEQEEEVIQTKQMINQLCSFMGKPALYSDAQLTTSKTATVRADEYYGKPLQTAIREVLERRKHIGPASAREIYDALLAGGYDGFRTKDEQNRITGLRISLRKNSKIFHKLPNGEWGLVDWYEQIRNKRSTQNDTEPEADNGNGVEDEDEKGGDENEEG